MPDHPQNPGNEIYGSVYEKNHVVFGQGDAGDQMFIIQSGAVEVSQRRGDREVVLAILEKGDFFGEMALISRQPRSATVTTIQRSRLLPLSRELLLDKMWQAPETALHLLKTLIHRIHRADRRINEMLEGNANLRRIALETASPLSNGGGDGKSTAEAFADEASAAEIAVQEPTAEKTAPEFPTAEKLVDEEPAAEEPAAMDLSFDEMGAVWDAGAQSISVEAGEVIFSEGDPGDGMYVIADGRVAISRYIEGEPRVLAVLQRHDLLGEMALITGQARSAGARAIEPTRLIPIRPATFSSQIRQEPRLAFFLLECLILKLHQKETACRSNAAAAQQLRQGLLPLLKRSKRLRVAMVSLSTCGGCGARFLEDQAAFGRILDRAELVYFPMLIDEEIIPDADVILVDGGVRVKEDEEKLIEARRKSRWLVAFGTCAVYGGVPALANRFELEDLIEASYGHSRDLFAYYLNAGSGVAPSTFQQRGLKLTRRFWKISDHARADYFLPGCPPPPALFLQLLRELRGDRIEKPRPIVCAECSRKAVRQKNGIGNGIGIDAPDAAVCLLSQGACCLGFLMRGGCGAVCTSAGAACWGCRGPSEKTIRKLKAGEKLADLLVDRMARLCRMDREAASVSVRQFMLQTHSALNHESNPHCDGARIR